MSNVLGREFAAAGRCVPGDTHEAGHLGRQSAAGSVRQVGGPTATMVRPTWVRSNRHSGSNGGSRTAFGVNALAPYERRALRSRST
jgi:hypothetical protein